MRARTLARFVCAAASGLLAACGAVSFDGAHDFSEINGPTRLQGNSGSPLELMWRASLVPDFSGIYEPLETAVAALDPSHDRVYVGSSAGSMYAFTARGRRIWRTDLRAAIDGQAAIDPNTHELYVGTSEGTLASIDARTGRLRWQKPAGAAIRNQPVLAGDAVYAVAINDSVLAMSRTDGELLWRYRRDQVPEGFSLDGHAGLTLVDNRVITGFTDGSVVALDAADGHVLWERNTTDDLDDDAMESNTHFKDVDTTPVVDGTSVFVASFSAGVYELALSNGSVKSRIAERTGVSAITLAESKLLLSSSDEGLVCLDRADGHLLWRRNVSRGAASGVEVVTHRPGQPQVLVGENMGAFLAVSLNDGTELSRWESGHGFAARPSTFGRMAFVVTNGGALLAFALR